MYALKKNKSVFGLIFFFVTASSSAMEVEKLEIPSQACPHLPAINRDESNALKNSLPRHAPKPYLPASSITANMAKEALHTNDIRKILPHFDEYALQYELLRPYLALAKLRPHEHAVHELEDQSLEQLCAIAEYANYLDIPALLKPLLAAIIAKIKSPDLRAKILQGEQQIPLSIDLRHAIAPQCLSVQAKIEWLLRQRYPTSRRAPTYQLSNHAGETNEVLAATFDSTGTLLAAGNKVHTIDIWRMTEDPPVHEAHTPDAHQDWVTSLAFYDHDNRLASASDDAIIKIWDTRTHKCIKIIPNDDNVSELAVSSDDDFFVSANVAGLADQWDATTGYLINNWQADDDALVTIALHPDNNQFITGSVDHIIRMDVRMNSPVAKYATHGLSLNTVRFNPTGLEFATAHNDRFCMRDTRMEKILFEQTHWDFNIIKRPTHSLAFSPQGNYLAAGHQCGHITYTELKTHHTRKLFYCPSSAVHGLALTPDGLGLATGNRKGDIFYWKLGNTSTHHYLEHIPSPEAALLLEQTYHPHHNTCMVAPHLFNQLPETLRRLHDPVSLRFTKKSKS